MLRYLPLIWKNSLRNRRRSLLTIGSIAVSLCLLGVLMAMYQALFHGEATPGQALRLVARHRVSLAQSLPYSYKSQILRVPGVKEVSTWDWFGGTYKDARDQKNFFARFAVEPQPFFTIRTQMEMPEDQRRAFLAERSSCIVSKDLVEKHGFKMGDRITITGDIYPVTLELTMRGVFEDPDATQSLFFHKDYLRELLPGSARQDRVGTFAILANSTDDVPRIAKAIDAMYENAPEPTKTESEQQFALSFVSFLGNIKLFLLSICGAVTFTILLVSGNTMAMSVRERIAEVGILKTLGFTNNAILGIVIGESAVIALIGGVLGLLLAGGLISLVSKSAQNIVQHLTLTPAVVLISLALAVFIGLISSFIPAWNAARTSILDSLRYAG